MWGPFCYFSPYRRSFFHVGDLFWLAPPHPTKISAITHGPCHDINLNVKICRKCLCLCLESSFLKLDSDRSIINYSSLFADIGVYKIPQ